MQHHAAVKATPAPCPWTSSFAGAQLVEQHFGVFQVGGVEAFGETSEERG
jgi:hypothetical protein